MQKKYGIMKSGLDAMSLFPLDDLLSGEFSGLEQNGKNKKKFWA